MNAWTSVFTAAGVSLYGYGVTFCSVEIRVSFVFTEL